MQDNRQLIKEAIAKMPIGEVYDTVEIVLKFTGAKTPKEVKSQLDSRFNNTSDIKVNAIPLGDWCKDNNYNRLEIFELLRDLGYLNEFNAVTDDGFGELHDLEPTDKISMKDIVIFNTTKVNGMFTVMINPSSPKYENFLAIISEAKSTYVGSKGYNAKKVCKTMKHLCPSYRIIA